MKLVCSLMSLKKSSNEYYSDPLIATKSLLGDVTQKIRVYFKDLKKICDQSLEPKEYILNV